MNYYCEICNYTTFDKYNFNKHLKTNKHVNIVKNSPSSDEMTPNGKQKNYVCIYCKNSYSTAGNLSKHKTICDEKKLYSLNHSKQLCEISSKIEEYENLLKQKDEIIMILKAEAAFLKTIINSTGSILKNSVSTTAFLLRTYADAPVLEKMDICNSLLNEQSDNDFIDDIIYNFKHKKLDAYIGDFIIKHYKKDDPSKQSIWNSDTNRLTYVIREIIANNEANWSIDKRGIKTTINLITPILDHIKEKLNTYLKKSYDLKNINDHLNNMDKLEFITDILKSINDNILSEQVLRYIAPYFYLNKIDKTAKFNLSNMLSSDIDN